jgi:AcrR family transcriptional regulator
MARLAKKNGKRKPVTARQKAQQARSKETVQRILDSAMALTAEKDADSVTMSEIAKRSGVVIGAIYRYFADKNAINKAILLQHYDQVEAMLSEHVRASMSPNELIVTVQSVYEHYFEMHQRDPLFRNIWSLVQTDAELQTLDVKDTLKNAEILSAVAEPLFPAASRDELMAVSVFLLHFAASSSRLALQLPKRMGQQIRPIYQDVIAGALQNLWNGAVPRKTNSARRPVNQVLEKY